MGTVITTPIALIWERGVFGMDLGGWDRVMGILSGDSTFIFALGYGYRGNKRQICHEIVSVFNGLLGLLLFYPIELLIPLEYDL